MWVRNLREANQIVEGILHFFFGQLYFCIKYEILWGGEGGVHIQINFHFKKMYKYEIFSSPSN